MEGVAMLESRVAARERREEPRSAARPSASEELIAADATAGLRSVGGQLFAVAEGEDSGWRQFMCCGEARKPPSDRMVFAGEPPPESV